MGKAFDGYSGAVSIGRRPLTNLRYTTIIAIEKKKQKNSTWSSIPHKPINRVKKSSEEYNRLYLNVKKT